MTKASLISLTLFITLLSSCKKSDDNEIDPLTALHGKYKPVQVTADKQIDVNMDGKLSTDLFYEVPNLASSKLELRTKTATGIKLLSLEWPNQSFSSLTRPTDFDPSVVINYPVQPTAFNFIINDSSEELNTKLVKFTNDYDYTIPERILLETDNKIRVIFNKRIYTSAGWQDVKVTAVYKRYTTTT